MNLEEEESVRDSCKVYQTLIQEPFSSVSSDGTPMFPDKSIVTINLLFGKDNLHLFLLKINDLNLCKLNLPFYCFFLILFFQS